MTATKFQTVAETKSVLRLSRLKPKLFVLNYELWGKRLPDM